MHDHVHDSTSLLCKYEGKQEVYLQPIKCQTHDVTSDYDVIMTPVLLTCDYTSAGAAL